MDTADLLRFLGDANGHGYAAGRNALTVREADHSTTIVYESGACRFRDNYFGGEPYGGRAVVLVNGRPVWMAVYYGRVEDPGAEVQPVYSFLQRALLRAPEDFPFRGPDRFTVSRSILPRTLEGSSTGDVATERNGSSPN